MLASALRWRCCRSEGADKLLSVTVCSPHTLHHMLCCTRHIIKHTQSHGHPLHTPNVSDIMHLNTCIQFYANTTHFIFHLVNIGSIYLQYMSMYTEPCRNTHTQSCFYQFGGLYKDSDSFHRSLCSVHLSV